MPEYLLCYIFIVSLDDFKLELEGNLLGLGGISFRLVDASLC